VHINYFKSADLIAISSDVIIVSRGINFKSADLIAISSDVIIVSRGIISKFNIKRSVIF